MMLRRHKPDGVQIKSSYVEHVHPRQHLLAAAQHCTEAHKRQRQQTLHDATGAAQHNTHTHGDSTRSGCETVGQRTRLLNRTTELKREQRRRKEKIMIRGEPKVSEGIKVVHVPGSYCHVRCCSRRSSWPYLQGKCQHRTCK